MRSLDGREADQLAIELVENVLRMRLAQFVAQIDGFRNGGWRAIRRVVVHSHARLALSHFNGPPSSLACSAHAS